MNHLKNLPILFVGSGAWLFGETNAAWKVDPQHRQLKYRVECSKGSSTVDWKNGYRSEVDIRANLRSAIYEGAKDIRIGPGGSAQSRLETMDCAPIRVDVTKFASAGMPAPVVVMQARARKAVPSKARSKARRSPARRKRRRPKVTPPVKAAKRMEPEISSEALALTKVGMTPEQVLRRLGAPAAKLTMPDEDEMIQIFSYRTSQDKMGAIYFTNGQVSEIRPPR